MLGFVDVWHESESRIDRPSFFDKQSIDSAIFPAAIGGHVHEHASFLDVIYTYAFLLLMIGVKPVSWVFFSHIFSMDTHGSVVMTEHLLLPSIFCCGSRESLQVRAPDS